MLWLYILVAFLILSVDCCSFSVASGDVPAQPAVDHNLIDFDTE